MKMCTHPDHIKHDFEPIPWFLDEQHNQCAYHRPKEKPRLKWDGKQWVEVH